MYVRDEWMKNGCRKRMQIVAAQSMRNGETKRKKTAVGKRRSRRRRRTRNTPANRGNETENIPEENSVFSSRAQLIRPLVLATIYHQCSSDINPEQVNTHTHTHK